LAFHLPVILYGCEAYKLFAGKPERKRQLDDLDVNGPVTSKLIFEEYDCKVWIGFIWLRLRAGNKILQNSNEPMRSIKGGEFLD
jgi:hypothetical protein